MATTAILVEPSISSEQLELFARQKLRPVWHLRSEVEANLSKRTTF